MHLDNTKAVFVNCPFDEAYKDIFYAIIFTVFDCGFNVRCGLEIEDIGGGDFNGSIFNF